MVKRIFYPLTVDAMAARETPIFRTNQELPIYMPTTRKERQYLVVKLFLKLSTVSCFWILANGKEVMIFPRFQQLDAVLKIVAHAKIYNTGHNYLIQHSAGSGKSNTIAWIAHSLINVHDDNDKAIFDTVIIVTDRIVLDRQLQNTVAQFGKTQGVVKKIEGTSRQLKDAIENNARIIITTIHKFSTAHLTEVSGQSNVKFAILVDEAHGSQSGRHADNLAKTLSREDEENTALDIENIIANHQPTTRTSEKY